MEYDNEILIKKPIEEVIEKFQDPECLKHWQPGLQKMELVSGEEGKSGSVYNMHFKMGKRDVLMKETILQINLPEVFEATYEAKNVWNKEYISFERVNDQETKYHAHSIFKFSGFMKIIGALFPKAFKKQSCKYMENFKAFVEDGTSVLDAKKN